MKIRIETETRNLEGNEWTPAGPYYTACFEREPEGVKGYPMGRSHVSVSAAIADLVRRTNDESGTTITKDCLVVAKHRECAAA